METVRDLLTDKEIEIAFANADFGDIEYREVVKYNNICTIPEVVITAHNAAARNETSVLKEVPTDLHNQLVSPPMILAPKK